MPESREREPSASVGLEDSDKESHFDRDSQPPSGKPGRKKNANSQAARRDQNRIAQREFRLRKQQRIRDLEARVEILSGGKDEALSEIRNILKDLMEENQQLRMLLRSVSAFIGDGAGGLLERIGWTLADFNNYVNKSETDTAWESYQRRKRNNPSTSSANQQAQKRPSEDDALNPSRPKRSRGRSEQDGEHEDRYNLFGPMNSSSTATHLGVYPPSSTKSPQEGNLFPPTSPIFTRSPATSNDGPYSGAPSSSSAQPYTPSYLPPINLNIDHPSPYSSSNAHGSAQQQRQGDVNPQDIPDDDDDDDSNKNDAYKLISYHLDNFHRINTYHLPASLRPTLVQRNVTHETIIDKIPHPEIRDRMILLRGRFDLADCLVDFRSSVTIHGDDVLAHSNWELSEKWLRKYHFLIDQPTVDVTNRWRRERGEPELRYSDLNSPDISPSAA